MCLIPEIKFDLDKLCAFVQTILERKDYCVVCVAEGALWRGVKQAGCGLGCLLGRESAACPRARARPRSSPLLLSSPA